MLCFFKKPASPHANSSGFTLLEIIIVIIIVSVLTSLALPRFFRLIELSRATEAVVNLKVIREAIERCYLMNYGNNGSCACVNVGTAMQWDKISLDNLDNVPGARFNYVVSYCDNVTNTFKLSACRRPELATPSCVNNIELINNENGSFGTEPILYYTSGIYAGMQIGGAATFVGPSP